MSVADLLIALLLIAAAWHVVATLLLYDALRKRGRRPVFLLLRLHGPWYANEYRAMTREERGRTGPLFLHWAISINAALLLGIALILAAVL